MGQALEVPASVNTAQPFSWGLQSRSGSEGVLGSAVCDQNSLVGFLLTFLCGAEAGVGGVCAPPDSFLPQRSCDDGCDVGNHLMRAELLFPEEGGLREGGIVAPA